MRRDFTQPGKISSFSTNLILFVGGWMTYIERLHIELFSHLTGLAAFHQSTLHVLQPGEGKRGEGREGRNEIGGD